MTVTHFLWGQFCFWPLGIEIEHPYNHCLIFLLILLSLRLHLCRNFSWTRSTKISSSIWAWLWGVSTTPNVVFKRLAESVATGKDYLSEALQKERQSASIGITSSSFLPSSHSEYEYPLTPMTLLGICTSKCVIPGLPWTALLASHLLNTGTLLGKL